MLDDAERGQLVELLGAIRAAYANHRASERPAVRRSELAQGSMRVGQPPHVALEGPEAAHRYGVAAAEQRSERAALHTREVRGEAGDVLVHHTGGTFVEREDERVATRGPRREARPELVLVVSSREADADDVGATGQVIRQLAHVLIAIARRTTTCAPSVAPRGIRLQRETVPPRAHARADRGERGSAAAGAST